MRIQDEKLADIKWAWLGVLRAQNALDSARVAHRGLLLMAFEELHGDPETSDLDMTTGELVAKAKEIDRR